MSRHLEEERIETYDEGNRDGELSVCPWPRVPAGGLSREEAARSLHRVERKACRQPGHRWRRGDKDTHTVVQGEHRQS